MLLRIDRMDTFEICKSGFESVMRENGRKQQKIKENAI